MTCREKFIADHPDWIAEKINYTINTECPSVYGYLDDPDYCAEDCTKCWNREIPETKPSESSEATNDELVKRIADLEQRNKNQCDLIEKKTVELTIAHARIGELTGDLEKADKIKKEQANTIDRLQRDRDDLLLEIDRLQKELEDREYPDNVYPAIALSMFNKYHALLDVGFSSDEALKLTVMWKD